MSLSPLLLCRCRTPLSPWVPSVTAIAYCCRHLGRHPERHEALHWGGRTGRWAMWNVVIVPHAVYRLAKPVRAPGSGSIQGVTGGRSGERVQRPGSLTL